MHLIKPCPSCGKKLRFPITEGEIKVTCRCGSSFVADPDDQSLYCNAEFDLRPAPGRKPPKNTLRHFTERIKGITIKEITTKLINRMLDIKYKIQNFRHLPVKEQRKIFLILMITAALLSLLITAIYFCSKTVNKNVIII